jgi:hypothetical protein
LPQKTLATNAESGRLVAARFWVHLIDKVDGFDSDSAACVQGGSHQGTEHGAWLGLLEQQRDEDAAALPLRVLTRSQLPHQLRSQCFAACPCNEFQDPTNAIESDLNRLDKPVSLATDGQSMGREGGPRILRHRSTRYLRLDGTGKCSSKPCRLCKASCDTTTLASSTRLTRNCASCRSRVSTLCISSRMKFAAAFLPCRFAQSAHE